MRLPILAVLLPSLLGSAAFAQTPPAELGARTIPAPWWMRDPVIASLGSVRVELPANRARFAARFSAVERDAAAATLAAARKVAELDAALRQFGAERVRLTTTFTTRPLYEQYRDKDGNQLENQRADKIERYEVTAAIDIEVRDVSALEGAYNAVVNARATAITPVSFRLEPENKTKAALANEAVRDAARRARAAAEASGARIGAVKIIDPTARVCRTDVLAGWPSYVGGTRPTDVDAEAMAAPPPRHAPTTRHDDRGRGVRDLRAAMNRGRQRRGGRTNLVKSA